MLKTIIKNGKILTPFRVIEGGYLVYENGVILEVCEKCLDTAETSAEVIDAGGAYISPGFIDMHVHGGGGYEVMDGTAESIRKMCEAHAFFGTTSILPTTLAAPLDITYKAVDAVREAAKSCKTANILGVHLEGPYFSPAQRGAQAAEHLRVPQKEEYTKLLDYWDGIKVMGAAPELEGALDLGRELKRRGIVASIAHSDADYDTVIKALEYGYSDVTHIYSGCSSVHRKNAFRVAGVVESGFAFDELTVQVIADGKHLPASLLQLIYKIKGADKISLITDGLSFSARENTEGEVYTQKNGVPYIYEDGVMKLLDRQSFAGSSATSNMLVRNMVKMAGAGILDAVKMASATPARILGVDRKKGTLARGMDADIVIFDDNFEVNTVIVSGNIIKKG